MRLKTLVFRELFQRKNKLLTSLLAIVLGIAIITFINNTTTYSEKAIAKELDALGANILILHPSATLENYYSADLGGWEIPEEYVTRLTLSNLEGLDNLSPKLSIPTEIQNQKVTLTGILPKNEFQSKASWQGVGIFSKPKGCGNVQDIFGLNKSVPKETLVRKRVIDTLNPAEVLIGADVAAKLGIKENTDINILKQNFRVIAILPQTGTIDDSRVFTHLHKVQELAGKGPVVHAIEVVGCCQEISKGLVAKINSLIPEAKIVTISQLVDTQIKTNHTMQRLSLLFLGIVIVIGGASIANDMYSNVSERKKEIGTLMALGATTTDIMRIFLLKALLLGVFGGIIGYIIGSLMALFLGPIIAGVNVLPEPMLFFISVGISMCITVSASYFPAKSASRLDPCMMMKEI